MLASGPAGTVLAPLTSKVTATLAPAHGGSDDRAHRSTWLSLATSPPSRQRQRVVAMTAHRIRRWLALAVVAALASIAMLLTLPGTASASTCDSSNPHVLRNRLLRRRRRRVQRPSRNQFRLPCRGDHRLGRWFGPLACDVDLRHPGSGDRPDHLRDPHLRRSGDLYGHAQRPGRQRDRDGDRCGQTGSRRPRHHDVGAKLGQEQLHRDLCDQRFERRARCRTVGDHDRPAALRDELPGGHGERLDLQQPPPGTLGATVTCTVDPLENGGTVASSIGVKVKAHANRGPIVNQAAVTSATQIRTRATTPRRQQQP